MNDLMTWLFLAFMSLVYVVYMILPKKARPYCLLVFSLLFYVVYSKFLTFFMLSTILSIWLGGLWLNRIDDGEAKKREGLEKEARKALKKKVKRQKRLVVALIIIFNVAILATLKYFNFFGSLFEGFLSWFNLSVHMPILKIALPLGISYYTLSAIGYIVDVSQGRHRAGNLLSVALFISYFPQLFEGPFATYSTLAPQLMAGEGFNSQNLFSGLSKVLWGFFKKVVIADRLAIVVSAVFSNYASYSGLVVVLGIIAFTFELYAEFSGLIDVASGISEMFSIRLAKNFEQPFFSTTVSEFWRRWHMSLGAWFRQYIFYPVSMSQGMMKINKKLAKKNSFWQVFVPSALALFVVWLLNGLWHGADIKYIVYGMYYYVLMMLGMALEPLFNLIYKKSGIDKNSKWVTFLKIARTFILVNIGLLIFRAATLKEAANIFTSIFQSGELNLISLGVIDIYDTIWCFIGVAILLVYDYLAEKKKLPNSQNWHTAGKVAFLIAMAVMIIVFGAYGEGYIPPDPIYGGF